MKKEKVKIPEWVSDIARAVEVEGKALDMRAVSLKASKNGIRYATSSGSLAIDLISGGGWAPGRVVSTYGPEQSGKTTDAYETLAWSLLEGTVCFLFDAEQATDASYLDRIILKVTGYDMNHFLGEIDGDKIVKPGLLYYIQPTTGEAMFTMINRILKTAIPDVIRNDKHGWCWVVKGRTKNDYTLKKRDIGGAISSLIIIDSLAALIPEAKEKDDQSNPIGMLARMLSSQLPKTVNRCGRKRCTLLYTNQIRNKIGVMFGSPETEVGGEAPKFYSSQRIRFSAVSLSTVEKVFAATGSDDEGKGLVDVEPSWNNEGNDKFRYSKIKINKNKSFSPFQETFVRWRFEKGGQQGDGLDPVFDVYMYLYQTGQCSKKTGRGIIQLSILPSDEGKKVTSKFISALTGNKKKVKDVDSYDTKVTWIEFKGLIENPEHNMILRKHCARQIQSGYAYSLYFAKKSSNTKDKE